MGTIPCEKNKYINILKQICSLKLKNGDKIDIANTERET